MNEYRRYLYRIPPQSIGETMSSSRISVPSYKPIPPVKRSCTTVRLTEKQFYSLPKLKEGIGCPSLASTVLTCIHQLFDDMQNNLCSPEEYIPTTEPNPFTFNFSVSEEDRIELAELKCFYGMRTNSQLIGFILDKYADALESRKAVM